MTGAYRTKGSGMRWGREDEQGPGHVRALKAALKSLHFILMWELNNPIFKR